ncbi:MAG: hypothetical protein ACE5JM_08895, partial [Armatimonadota bacterium]
GDAPVELGEIYPTTLPDLFAGEELVVFGRYRVRSRDRAGTVAVTGRQNGRTERFATRATFPEHALGNAFIPRLWASRKIGVLSREIRLNGANAELEREIRETALRYGLLSEYTSYLVEEPMDLAGQPAGRRDSIGRTRVSQMPAAQAPAQAAGAVAVAAAEESRIRRVAKSFADLEEADEALLARGHMSQSRHVAGRLFIEQDGVWTDLRHADSLRTVTIEPYSQAYFQLLRLAPEIKPYLSEFEQVLVAGAQASVRIAHGGVQQMASDRLARLVREFRGR